MSAPLTDGERAILETLADVGEEMCLNFRGIGGDRATTRRACRKLARQGLAAYHRGLLNEDGEAAGSGYGITPNGIALMAVPA